MNRKYSQSTEGMDVEYVAHLARLKLSAEEITQFQAQLDQVLKYVDELSTLDVAGVEPTAHAMPIHNVFRKDEVRPSMPRDEALANAPAQHQQQFLMPKIVE